MQQVVIFGAGALGTVLGARLATVRPVALVARPAAARAIRRRGLVVHGEGAARLDPGAVTVTHRPRPFGPRCLVVVAVKLPDLAAAGRSLAALAAEDTCFLLVQNGLEGRELFLGGAGRPLLTQRAIASMGAELLAPGEAVCAGGGLTLERSPCSAALALLFRKAHVPCTESPDFERALWKKLAVNCVANPLTAILDVRNCDVITPDLAPVRRAVCAEVAALAAHAGHPLPEDLPERIDAALGASSNRSSMLQDLTRGRPTEIDYLNGFVARRAEELGLAAPVNATLAALVRARTAAAAAPYRLRRWAAPPQRPAR